MSDLLTGFAAALEPGNLLFIVAGTALGIFAGAMPGLSSTVGLAIVLPITFALDPAPALLMMVALYMAAEYGGSITAIAIGVPGSSPALATVLDGYPMSRQGQAGRALGISLFSSVSGGLLGAAFLILALGPLVRAALAFGPVEYFALGVFGLSIVSNLVGTSPVRGVISALLGLLLFVVGLDVLTGAPRLTFGTTALMDGIGLVPVLIGFFAVAEAFRFLGASGSLPASGFISGRLPRLSELVGLWPSILRGSAIGGVIGAIPGAGATIASLIAWSEERRFSKRPESFGHGAPEGIAAPESANNACVGAALIPLLALGIPGSASTAVLLGGLAVHGIAPGPLLLDEHADLVYALYAGLMLAVASMLAIGLLGIPIWTRVVRLRTSTLMPLVIGISLVGTFALRGNPNDAWMALGTGVLGFVMMRLEVPLVPAILGLVLGPMIETNYRRALTLSGGNHITFLTSPISLVLLSLALVSFAMPALRRRLARSRADGPTPTGEGAARPDAGVTPAGTDAPRSTTARTSRAGRRTPPSTPPAEAPRETTEDTR